MTGSVELLRGETVESRHEVHLVAVDGKGRLVASLGDPHRLTNYRSAAKPLQTHVLVESGAADALGVTDEELAICCASHNAEPKHLEVVRGLLARAGVEEGALECGPHLPLLEAEARRLLAAGGEPGPIHNNCSGKHAGMLALAVHEGWPPAGYRQKGHPVQRRVADEISRWSGVPARKIPVGVDGCGVACFSVPLDALAGSFVRLARAAERGEEGPRRVVDAMTGHPFLVAGTGRLCTELMTATEGRIFAKVGAEGVYAATLRDGSLAVALKVEDGARRAAEVALVTALEELGVLEPDEVEALGDWRPHLVRNTRGEPAARLQAAFDLERAAPESGGE